MIERPSMHALALFLAVVDHGTMTAAGEAEGIAQPAISQHVHNLERYFGVPLIERHGRHVRPTAAGLIVATYTRQLLSTVDAMQQALDDLAGLRRGRLVIGASATVAETWLPRVLGEYRVAFPEIELQVAIGNSDRILRDVLERRVGLAVIGRPVDVGDIEATPVFEDRLALFVAANHPLASRGSITLRDLGAETFVFREPGSATRDFMLGCLEERGFRPIETIQLGSNEAVKRGVAARLGVGILSAQTLEVDLRAGDIAILDCTDWTCRREFWRIRRRDRVLSAAEQAFIDRCQA